MLRKGPPGWRSEAGYRARSEGPSWEVFLEPWGGALVRFFINLTWGSHLRRGTLAEESHLSDWLLGIFLINDWFSRYPAKCEDCYPWAGGSGLHSKAKQASREQTSKSCSSRCLLVFLPPGFCHEFLPWLPSVISCKINQDKPLW